MRNLYSHNGYNTLPGIDLFVCIHNKTDYFLRLSEHRDNSHLNDRINRIIKELRKHYHSSRNLSIEVFQVAELYKSCTKLLMRDITQHTYYKYEPIGTHILYRQYVAIEDIRHWFIKKGGRTFTETEVLSQGRFGIG